MASLRTQHVSCCTHDDVIKWKHCPRYWPFVRGIHRSPVNSPHKGQWRGALMFSLIGASINGWVNNLEIGDLSLQRLLCDDVVKWEHFSQNWLFVRENHQPSANVHHTKRAIHSFGVSMTTILFQCKYKSMRHFKFRVYMYDWYVNL